MDTPALTIALTHYNRFTMLLESIQHVRGDSRVREIVISDDCSTDGSYERLQEEFKGDPKFVLFRNARNLDCYRNKWEAVRRATNNWVILLDSDNIIDRGYLDALTRIPQWDARTFYCPEFAMPSFDYREFSGKTVDHTNVAEFMYKSKFACALNTANYLVPREGYLQAFDKNVDPHTSDSIFIAHNWLRSGGKMHVVPGLRYQHRIHDGSHFKQNHHKTGDFAKWITNKLIEMR